LFQLPYIYAVWCTITGPHTEGFYMSMFL